MKLETTSNSEEAQNPGDSSKSDCVTQYRTCHSCGTIVQYTDCKGAGDHEEKLKEMCEKCAGAS